MEETPAFQDVKTSDWFYNAVQYVAGEGLMSGVSASSFGPSVNLSRAMLAQMLYAMEGKPAVSGASGFSDVPTGEWFASAVNWAAAQGVVAGTGGSQYSPNSPLTREQMAQILYSYAKYKGYDTTQGGMAVREFADSDKISGWAAEAVSWAVSEGLLSGSDGNRLNPTGTATRAQVAQVLMNFCQNVAQ